jgi:hypothetical protein
MDPVKKIVANRLSQQVGSVSHPDAELLSGFAENALSPTERANVLEHLSDCAACREVLFLALPHTSDTQNVLSVTKARPRFAVRWGTLAASVAIVSVLIVARHERARTPLLAKQIAAPSGYAEPPTVAVNKVPAEVDAMREPQPSATVAAPSVKRLPDEKHMEAKPAIAMEFGPTGQVSVAPAAPSADRVDEWHLEQSQVLDSQIKDVPVTDRNTRALVKVPAANAPALPASQNVVAQTANELYAYEPSGAFYSHGGNLGGLVVDSTGAAVADAKVTTVGPTGTKTVTSKADGKFSFDQVPTGSYSLKAVAPGFKATELDQVAVLASKPSEVRLKLDVGTTTETVEVTASAMPMSPARRGEANWDANANASAAMVANSQSQVVAKQKAETTGKKTVAARLGASNAGALAADAANAPAFQWTLSPVGAVQRSLDGRVWETLPVAPQALFRTLSAVGQDIWVGGKAGTLYHSPDSGQHWTRVVPEMNGEKLIAEVILVSFSDSRNGTVSTLNGQRWSTSDGGQTWLRK